MEVKKIKIDKLNNEFNNVCFDLFICCASFENRCLSVSDNINKDIIKNVIVFYNTEYIDTFKDNVEKLNYFYKNNKIIEGKIKIENPLFTADTIMNSINSIIVDENTIYNVLIDITTFTHESLLILEKILLSIYKDKFNIYCIYTSAKNYNDSNKDETNKWLSKGIFEIRSVLGYSGNIDPSKKTHLVMISGYEYERSVKIVEKIEPNFLSISDSISDSSTTSNPELQKFYKKLISQLYISYKGIKEFNIYCDDVYKTYKEIYNHILEIENESNVVVSALNNKITTIAAGLVGIKKDNVQICYAPAVVYNIDDYSTTGDYCYIFNLTDLFKKIEEEN